MKLFAGLAVTLALTAPAVALDYCKHEDAAAVLEPFYFDTEPGAKTLLAFIADENIRHQQAEESFAKASSQFGSDPSFIALQARVQAKRDMSKKIEEELRCRLGETVE